MQYFFVVLDVFVDIFSDQNLICISIFTILVVKNSKKQQKSRENVLKQHPNRQNQFKKSKNIFFDD